MIRKILNCIGWKYIDREKIVEIAEAYCHEKDWPWIEPIIVEEGPIHTSVGTNTKCKGGNVGIKIDARTGKIVSAGYIPY